MVYGFMGWLIRMDGWGRCKSWTLDSGLDHGLDRGLDGGLDFGPDFGPKFGPSFGLVIIACFV